MNKKRIIELLNPYIHRQSVEEITIDNLEWDIAKSTKTTAVFYKLERADASIKKLHQRIKSSPQYGLLLVNRWDSSFKALKNIIVLEHRDWLIAQKVLANALYPLKMDEYKYVAVTGTNGKTTTVELARQIADQQGASSMSIGTLGISIGKERIYTGLTTPPYFEIRKYLHKFKDSYEMVFFEASSHALDQDRLKPFKFCAVGWSSFSLDHLDYHGTQEIYFSSKCKLIENHLCENAQVFVPAKEESLIKKLQIYPNVHGTRDNYLNVDYTKMPLFYSQSFNYNNLQLALALVDNVVGLKKRVDLDTVTPPPGRSNMMLFGDKTVVVDFAHTPDALQNICRELKSQNPTAKLHLVFGCGGDRDKEKRPLMGKIANDCADKIYVTTDNPRNENPMEIIDGILSGIENAKSIDNLYVDQDRRSSIEFALHLLQNGDLLLIAGKGHERFQIVGDKKIPFDDEQVVRQYFEKE